MKRLLPVTLAAVLIGCSLPGVAQAWTPMSTCNGSPTAWAPGSPNTVWRLSSTYTYSGLTNSQIDAALNGAFNEWGVPGCSEFNATQSSDTAGNPMDNNNSNHIVGFYESSWPGSLGGSSTLAVTMPSWFANDCEITGSDMVVNAFHHDWVIGQPSNWDSADLQSVIAHEAGHWVGFGHNTYAGSTLAATYSNGIAERTLTCDDTEGVCDLYPSSGNACTDDRYCDCGVGCNGGYCGGTPTGDDDDSTPPGDDDTTGDDDDDNGGDISGPCSGSSETHYETEPNDWDGEDDVDWIQSGGGDTSLVGSLTCGNNGQSYTGDKDWFVVDFPCTDTARFSLDWKTSSDLDFYIYGSGSDPLYQSVSAEMAGPVQVDGTASGRIYLVVMCWDGANATYEFLVDFAPFQGSSGGGGDDDDTSSGDDDTGGGDDDDTGSGDDDAGGGDDDDAGAADDDDSEVPARRGCDCYSTQDSTFAMTGTGPLGVGLLLSSAFLFGLRRRRNDHWN